MHIIFATASFASQYLLLGIAQNILEAWPKIVPCPKLSQWLRENPDPKRVTICDSGVFSTWSQGNEVDINAYAEFYKDQNDIWKYFVNCDVIPGTPGHIPTDQEVEESAQKGWDNWMTLLDAGLPAEKVIHVFHQNEDLKWLEKLMDFQDKYVKDGYIGISPANDRTPHQRMLWLDQVMPYICNKDGSARIKFHGFGVTSVSILKRFPWFTADSTSWMRAGAMGRLKIPQYNKKFPHLESKTLIAVTKGTGESKGTTHYDSLGTQAQKMLQQYVESNGFTIEDVAQDEHKGVLARQTCNLNYWKHMEKELNTFDLRWKPSQPGFL